MRRLKIAAIVVLLVGVLAYSGICGYVYLNQRSLLFRTASTHKEVSTTLDKWTESGEYFGLKREPEGATVAWLFLHGNNSQVQGDGPVRRVGPSAAVYLVEYPGYGHRAGTASCGSINDAVMKAYETIVAKGFKEIGVIGVSLGSGPASMLAKAHRPPDKIVLVVPFDSLTRVAQDRYPFLPFRLLFTEDWDNIAALRNYTGKVDIFAGDKDPIMPNAKNIATSIKGAKYVVYHGGHDDFGKEKVVFTIK